MDDEEDFLEEFISERTQRNPNFPTMVEAAGQRHQLLRELDYENEELTEKVEMLEQVLTEQNRQIEVGVQELIETYARVADGDSSARVLLPQGHILWKAAEYFNTLLGRLQILRQADYQLQRTDEEIAHLAATLAEVQAGHHPTWPVPSGTNVDLLLAALSSANKPISISDDLPQLPAAANQKAGK